jgi:hypothetical protein
MKFGMLLAATLLLASIAPGHARADPVEDARRFARKVLAPLTPGSEFMDGWTWTDVEPRCEGIVLVFQAPPGGGTTRIMLSPRDDSGRRYAATDSLNLVHRVPPDGQRAPNEKAVLEEVRRLAEGNDTGGLSVPRMREGCSFQEPSQLLGLARGSLAFMYVVLVLVSLILLGSALRTGPPPPAFLLALAALTGLAVALRFGLSPHAFMHEYYQRPVLWETMFSSPHGEAGRVLYHLVHRLAGGAETGVFATNAVLASLTIPAVILLGLALFRDRSWALFAGLILCLTPQHLRFSGSDDAIVPAALFAVWSLVLALHYVRTRGLLPLAGLVAALAVTMQYRSELLAFPAVMVAFVVLVHGREGLRAVVAPRALVAWVLLGMLVLPRVVVFLFAPGGGLELGGGSSEMTVGPLSYFWTRHVLLKPSITPPMLLVLVVLGAFHIARTRPGVLAGLLMLSVGYSMLTASLHANIQFLTRTQVFCTPFFALIASASLPLARLVLEGWPGVRRGAVAILLAIPLVSLLVYRDFVTRETDAMQEWEFLVKTVPALPEGQGRLIALVKPLDRAMNPFPAHLVARSGKQMQLVDIREIGNVRAPDPGDERPDSPRLLYYQGMNCYIAMPEDPPPEPMDERCVAVNRRFILRPWLTRQVDGVPSSTLVYTDRGLAPFLIGFFEVVRERDASDAENDESPMRLDH